MDAVWAATQDPSRHGEWDLRFSRIEYLPRSTPDEPQRFSYTTHIGFGLRITGRGESVGSLEKNGERTSALRFCSDDGKSLIREGSGYWKYAPIEGGVRFLTRYDYTTRFGAAGALLDRLVFRPLIGWATAWSFDCLRISLERGVPPRSLVACSSARAAIRTTLALVWMYQGLVPKLLFRDERELAMLRGSNLFTGQEEAVLLALGLLEILFGALLLVCVRSTGILWVMVAVLMVLLAGATFGQPSILAAPFNPVSLTLAMIGLAAVEFLLIRTGLPSASRCLRAPVS
jgi:hypothetical protein